MQTCIANVLTSSPTKSRHYWKSTEQGESKT